jgi:hypothetical protein
MTKFLELKIFEKNHAGSEKDPDPDPDPKLIEKSDPDPDPKKIISDPQHCFTAKYALVFL